MATTNIKRIVANALVDYFSTNIPALTGKVSAVIAGPEQVLACLALKVLPNDMTFEPAQEDEVYETVTDDNNFIADVGSFIGQYTLELYTNSPAERELVEQAILDLFMATLWAAGTLYITTPTLTVGSYVSLYSAEIKVRLTNEAWMDEMAFEAKRYVYLTVDVDMPALISRQAHNLDLQSMISTDFTAVITSVSQIAPSDQIDIQLDGSVIRPT